MNQALNVSPSMTVHQFNETRFQFTPYIHIWSNSISNKESERFVNNKEIPKDGKKKMKGITLGSKPFIDPNEKLYRRLSNISANVRRYMLQQGERLGEKSFSIKVESAQKVADKLKELIAEFNLAKLEFVSAFPRLVKEHAEKIEQKGFTEWAELIRKKAPPTSDIELAISFTLDIMKIECVTQDYGIEPEADHSHIRHQDLPLRVAQGIATDVRVAARSLFKPGKTSASQDVPPVIVRARDKAAEFADVNPRLASLVDLLDDVLGRLPKEGHLVGADYLLLQGVVSMLSDPDQILGAQEITKKSFSTSEVIQSDEPDEAVPDLNDDSLWGQPDEPGSVFPEQVSLPAQPLQSEEANWASNW